MALRPQHREALSLTRHASLCMRNACTKYCSFQLRPSFNTQFGQ